MDTTDDLLEALEVEDHGDTRDRRHGVIKMFSTLLSSLFVCGLVSFYFIIKLWIPSSLSSFTIRINSLGWRKQFVSHLLDCRIKFLFLC